MGMKRSTIKKLLTKKLFSWQESIEDQAVKTAVKDNTIVSGGCIASMLMGDPINDYDLYFRTRETAELVANYYITQFNKTKGQLEHTASRSINPTVESCNVVNLRGEEENRIVIMMKSSGVASETQEAYAYFENQENQKPEDTFMASLKADYGYESLQSDAIGVAAELAKEFKGQPGVKTPHKTPYRPIFLTDNAITLSDGVQLVIRFYGTPSEIHDNYDFAHAMCYYDWSTDTLVTPEESLICMLSKDLVYKGSLYPLCSLMRTRKFIARGWRISAGQMLKIASQVQKIDFSDPSVLREQLMGVDAAYMYELINAIKSHQGKIDDTYLAKLIDEVFDQ
jgi:hypothetical protein